ncbi:MAG: hypothetical protein OQL19_18755 [Gammaproteobacteria bacterium]|nr:hypothetical protein [Gammaproteobacteria bacterium]
MNETIGTLLFDSELDEGHTLYIHDNIKVLINEGLQERYVSVYIKEANNWSTDIELARDIANKLRVAVRCDPGQDYPNVSPYSNIFVEVTSDGEHLVEWG